MSSFYKNPNQNSNKFHEFNVDDESPAFAGHVLPYEAPPQPARELSPAEREELNKARQRSASGHMIGEYAKKRLELLTNIGRLTKNVTVGGITFSLRTLKTKEARETAISIFQCVNDVDAAYEIQRQSLARAIYQIDGQDIEAALGGSDFSLKLGLIDSMEDVVINKLYDEFNLLKNEVKSKFTLENEQQVKEVVEDLKK